MNFIQINDKKIELTDEQVSSIKESFCSGDIRLSDISEGETFKIGNYEFIVLQNHGDFSTVILKDLLKTSKFGDNNNYNGSEVDKICNEFADSIAYIIGKDKIIEHDLDLTSDDGLTDYGTVNRRVSLITTDIYRKFVHIFDKFKLDKWWWLATAHSTKKHENDTWIKCVAPSGYFNYDDYYDFYCGVRPFCVLKSDIFVSR